MNHYYRQPYNQNPPEASVLPLVGYRGHAMFFWTTSAPESESPSSERGVFSVKVRSQKRSSPQSGLALLRLGVICLSNESISSRKIGGGGGWGAENLGKTD